jgi:hypothetical protein
MLERFENDPTRGLPSRRRPRPAWLRDSLAAGGVRFSLVVQPPAKPREQWDRAELEAHEGILHIAAELGLRHFDLAIPLAVQQGRELQEQPGDPWHPHDDLAAVYADYLAREGLLAP